MVIQSGRDSIPNKQDRLHTSNRRNRRAMVDKRGIAEPLSSASPLSHTHKAEPIYLGVDVSKAWLDIADTKGRRARVANEDDAIRSAFAGPWAGGAYIVCEATGGYERALMRVARDLQLPLRRIHPSRARAFGQATAKLAKTDALDAQMLAKFAAFTVTEPWDPTPTQSHQELADMVSRLTQLKDLHHSEVCRAQMDISAAIRQSLAAMIDTIKAQIDAMQKAIDAWIAAHPRLRENAKILRSCKGIGPQSAQAILAMLPEIGTLNRRKVAALVGVAPITKTSGSSIKSASITGGRKALRDSLFMAALTASQHNPTFKTFYDRLRAKGKPHKVALIAVLRKLIITLNAMIHAKKMFEPLLT
jgi:transposase